MKTTLFVVSKLYTLVINIYSLLLEETSMFLLKEAIWFHKFKINGNMVSSNLSWYQTLERGSSTTWIKCYAFVWLSIESMKLSNKGFKGDSVKLRLARLTLLKIFFRWWHYKIITSSLKKARRHNNVSTTTVNFHNYSMQLKFQKVNLEGHR